MKVKSLDKLIKDLKKMEKKSKKRIKDAIKLRKKILRLKEVEKECNQDWSLKWRGKNANKWVSC